MGKSDHPVLIVGAGVSGLTTATTLAEAGVLVQVCSIVPPRETTSAAAGASWGPYLVTDERASEWSDTTLGVLGVLAGQRETGVRNVRGIDASRTPLDAPSWTRELSSYQLCHPEELPEGYVSGWWYEIPVVDMPVYLDFLTWRLARMGVEIQLARVDSLGAKARDRIVVNCTGVAARDLCHDEEITPTKGQLVVVKNPGVTTFFQDCEEAEEELIYFLPHGKHVVLGGCARSDIADLQPDPKVAREIIKRCARIEPRFAEAEVIEHRVGVRPSRTRVRLESEGNIIHNYGHGGAGLTLSWGCAAAVLELVEQLGVSHSV
jgi:D-amino-acid oxidase